MSWVLVCPPVIIRPTLTAKKCRMATMRPIEDSKFEIQILDAPPITIAPPQRDDDDGAHVWTETQRR